MYALKKALWSLLHDGAQSSWNGEVFTCLSNFILKSVVFEYVEKSLKRQVVNKAFYNIYKKKILGVEPFWSA